MHYLNPSAVGPGNGGVVETGFINELTQTTGHAFAPLDLFATDLAALSGVAVAQQPTCRNTGTAESDDYFNYGGHNPLGIPEGGAFQVMIPIGDGRLQTGINAEEMSMGKATAIAVTIANPAVLTRVDSWGAIVE
jgi:hypothetical protein